MEQRIKKMVKANPAEIKKIIERMRQENMWGYIEDAFIAMRDEIVETMRSGEIKTQEDLIKANAQLEILERCISLEFFKGR